MSDKVTVTLTRPQARALFSAASVGADELTEGMEMWGDREYQTCLRGMRVLSRAYDLDDRGCDINGINQRAKPTGDT